MRIKHLRKNGLPDRRWTEGRNYKQPRTLWGWEWKHYRAAIVAGALVGSLVTLVYFSLKRNPSYASYNAPGHSIGATGDIVLAVSQTPYCYDPITCVRDVGEELGVSNKDIMTMIRVAKCESGLRAEAINANTNRTVDRGVLQINTVHKRLSNADAFNFEKNIRFGWQLYFESGKTFRHWASSKKCWNQ